MINEKKSFVKYLMQIFLLKEELFENTSKEKLAEYLVLNHKKITNTINYEKFEQEKDIVQKFLQSKFIKKNYNELSDFVSDFYSNIKGS